MEVVTVEPTQLAKYHKIVGYSSVPQEQTPPRVFREDFSSFPITSDKSIRIPTPLEILSETEID